MNTVSISSEQRRALQKLAGPIGRMTRADSLFFERRPDRQYRVRPAHRAEIEERQILENLRWPIPDGCRVFIAVRQVAPGVRLRALVVALEGAETDIPESMARAIFEKATAGRFA